MGKMKNMIIIKDVKSNLIEEAIIVFKENVKIKEKQFLRQNCDNHKILDKDYCVKEAEDIISEYIEKVEENKNVDKIKIKFRALQGINIFLVLTLLLVLIF